MTDKHVAGATVAVVKDARSSLRTATATPMSIAEHLSILNERCFGLAR
jgi:hypothetical protein